MFDKQLLAFIGPAVVIPLGDPLMSLLDTVCIGQFAGSTQLAALGPSNLVFSFAQYVFQSLQVATLRCAGACSRCCCVPRTLKASLPNALPRDRTATR